VGAVAPTASIHTTPLQLNNIFNHILVIQAIINNSYFINKQFTKDILQKLIRHDFLKIIPINNTTTYTISNKNKLDEKIEQIKNDNTINKILNITKDIYISNALHYKVSD